MRSWKPQLVLALAGGAVLALAVTVFVGHGVVNVLLMVLVAAALVGMYLLRRYARAELVYLRHLDRRRRPLRTEPEATRNVTPPVGRTGARAGDPEGDPGSP